jgi:hypothetical protein
VEDEARAAGGNNGGGAYAAPEGLRDRW